MGKVVVIGAGAIGLLYAGALASVHPDRVFVITRRESLKSALAHGLTLAWPDSAPTRISRLEARLPAECPAGEADVALVAMAAYDSAEAGKLAQKLLKPDGLCITLQNGLDNQAALAASLGEAPALQGATSFPVPVPAAGEVSIQIGRAHV